MDEKISCPKCDNAAGYGKWIVWTDLSGRKLKCPSCKVLFIPEWLKFRFLNRPFVNILFQFVAGLLIAVIGILLTMIPVILFDLPKSNGFPLFICVVVIFLFFGGNIFGRFINKYCVLIDVPEIRESPDV